MAKYIEADKFKEELIREVCDYCSYRGNLDGGDPCRYCWARGTLNFIDDFEAEDVEPVRHAHWIEKNNPMFSPFDGSDPHIFYCSHCGKIDGQKYPFCHICGFKMDEEVSHEYRTT